MTYSMERTSKESAKPSRPKDIDRGVKLAYASLVFGMAAEIVDFRHSLTLDNLTTNVFFFGLSVFLIVKVSSGRNWARIVFLLMFLAMPSLGAIALLVGIVLDPMFLSPMRGAILAALKHNPAMTTVIIVVGLASFLLQAAALFLWFTRSSGEWFKGGTTTA